MILFLDTETTGLYPGNVCQLSYVLQGVYGAVGRNLFFTVDSVEYGAYKVHGFTPEKLRVLSGGKRFNDLIRLIDADLSSADTVVCHNAAFDVMFLRAEFERAGMDLPIAETFCTMKKSVEICRIPRGRGCGYKYPKLGELCEFYGITQKEIARSTEELFGAECGFHDARFDTAALYLAANRGMDNGYYAELKAKL